MTTAPLLVEILTEELPPKSLRQLSVAFANSLEELLRQKALLEEKSVSAMFATPRRLAVRLSEVRSQAPDEVIEDKGPYVNASLDAKGNPTPALQGFMKKKGVQSIDQL